MVLTVLLFLPASWMASLVEKQTQGRISLGDTQGSFWHGSAFVAGAPNGNAPVTPLFPGRFTWDVSPLIVFGQVRVTLENPESLGKPVKIQGGLSQWEISESSLILPSERLEGLGSPLNTIGPSGHIRLSWNNLQLTTQNGLPDLIGSMRMDLGDMASRMSPIKPLGSYQLTFDWRGQSADMVLATVTGPLLLSGNGKLQSGRFNFSGNAIAETGHEDELANLLNLLGQRRMVGGKVVTALELR
jgi:general secretion pathway protein N